MKRFSLGWTLIRIYTFLVYLFLFAPIIVVIVLAGRVLGAIPRQ